MLSSEFKHSAKKEMLIASSSKRHGLKCSLLQINVYYNVDLLM